MFFSFRFLYLIFARYVLHLFCRMLMTDIFGREHPNVFFKHVSEMILVIKSDLRGECRNGRNFSAVDQFLCPSDAIDIEIIFKRFVEALFKQSAKMLSTVLAVGRDIGGSNILIEIFIDVSADLFHKIKRINRVLLGFLEQTVADHLRIEIYDQGKCFYRPSVALIPIGRNDPIYRFAQHGCDGMFGRNLILKMNAFHIRKEMDPGGAAFGWK